MSSPICLAPDPHTTLDDVANSVEKEYAAVSPQGLGWASSVLVGAPDPSRSKEVRGRGKNASWGHDDYTVPEVRG